MSIDINTGDEPAPEINFEGEVGPNTDVLILTASEFAQMFPGLCKEGQVKVLSRFNGINAGFGENPLLISTPDAPAVLYEDSASLCTFVCVLNATTCLVKHGPMLINADHAKALVEAAKARLPLDEISLLITATNESSPEKQSRIAKSIIALFGKDMPAYIAQIFIKQTDITNLTDLFNLMEQWYIRGLVVIPSQLSKDNKVKLVLLVHKVNQIGQSPNSPSEIEYFSKIEEALFGEEPL